MSDPIPFDRFRRRLTRGRCEVPRCGRPTIGPCGFPGETLVVFPCASCARERYGTDDPYGVGMVLLGEEPFAPGEAAALAFDRPALAPRPAGE